MMLPNGGLIPKDSSNMYKNTLAGITDELLFDVVGGNFLLSLMSNILRHFYNVTQG